MDTWAKFWKLMRLAKVAQKQAQDKLDEADAYLEKAQKGMDELREDNLMLEPSEN